MLINLILTKQQQDEFKRLRKREVSALEKHDELTGSTTRVMTLSESLDFISDKMKEDEDLININKKEKPS